jgi:adenosylcobinamide-GDP ribazoletransferase
MTKSDPLRQLHLAFVLLTRLPLPHLPDAAFAQGARAVWAYPLVGLVVGAAGAATGQLALAAGLPLLAAAALALAVMIIATGAMHEDGLADTADGFWGGYTPARRLEIMRDSQIGTYGVLALVVAFVLRLAAVMALLGAGGWAALPVAAALSRAMMPTLMATLPPARSDGLSHSVGRPTNGAAAGAALLAGGITLAIWGMGGLTLLGIAAVAAALIAALARRKIGGQTGDVLGAAQQTSETALLLACAALI